MKLFFVLATIFSLVVALFATQNSDLVTIQFLIWQLPSVPQIVVILLSALGGMIAAFLFCLSRQYRLSKENSYIKNYAKRLEQELLKFGPIVESDQSTNNIRNNE